jgi:hypothetical protein
MLVRRPFRVSVEERHHDGLKLLRNDCYAAKPADPSRGAYAPPSPQLIFTHLFGWTPE